MPQVIFLWFEPDAGGSQSKHVAWLPECPAVGTTVAVPLDTPDYRGRTDLENTRHMEVWVKRAEDGMLIEATQYVRIGRQRVTLARITDENELQKWLPKDRCPVCRGEGYESHGGAAYMHDINCEL